MRFSISLVLAFGSLGLAVNDFGIKQLSPPAGLVANVPSASTDWKAWGGAIKLPPGVGATITDGEMIYAAQKSMNEIIGAMSKSARRKVPGMWSAMRYEDYIYFGSSAKGGGQNQDYYLKTDLTSPGPPPVFVAQSPDFVMNQLGGKHIRGGTCAEVTALREFDTHQRAQGSQEFKWPDPAKTKFVAFSSFNRVEPPCNPDDPNCGKAEGENEENYGCKQLLSTKGYVAPAQIIVSGNPDVGRWESFQFELVDPTCPLHALTKRGGRGRSLGWCNRQTRQKAAAGAKAGVKPNAAGLVAGRLPATKVAGVRQANARPRKTGSGNTRAPNGANAPETTQPKSQSVPPSGGVGAPLTQPSGQRTPAAAAAGSASKIQTGNNALAKQPGMSSVTIKVSG